MKEFQSVCPSLDFSGDNGVGFTAVCAVFLEIFEYRQTDIQKMSFYKIEKQRTPDVSEIGDSSFPPSKYLNPKKSDSLVQIPCLKSINYSAYFFHS